MTQVIFIDQQGNRHEVDAAPGENLMQVAINNVIPGIYGECGGTCSCATCHCYVADEWLHRLEPMSELEDGMLEGARDRRPNSRLGCQLLASGVLEGIILEVADNSP